MRKNSSAALAVMITIASVVACGCGVVGDPEVPASTDPVASALPDGPAVGASEESVRPFHPFDDCPQIGDQQGPSTTRNSGATSVTQSEPSESDERPTHDAIVSVHQYRPDVGDERTHVANGVVLAGTGYVATALDLSQPIGCLEVVLQGGEMLPARIVAIHRASGAILVEAEWNTTPSGVRISGSPVHSESAVHMYRFTSAGLPYEIPGATSAANSETVWILSTGPTGPTAGDAFFDSDGALVGVLTPHTWWRGALPSLRVGPPQVQGYRYLHGPYRALRATSLEQLWLSVPDEGLQDVPVRLYFGGPWRGWSVPYGDPVVIGEKVDSYLRTLEEPAEVEGLDGHVKDIIGPGGLGPGIQLELVYPVPKALESTDGRLLGFARYVMLWWYRGPDEPGLILTGPEPDRIAHAFEVEGLDGLENLARHRQPSNRAFRTSPDIGFPSEYPLRWRITSDRSVYSPGETVQISLQVENVSVIPVEIDLPSPFSVSLRDDPYSWQSEFVSGHEADTVLPGETLALTLDWDQTDVQGSQVPAGTYSVNSISHSAGSGAYTSGTSFRIRE